MIYSPFSIARYFRPAATQKYLNCICKNSNIMSTVIEQYVIDKIRKMRIDSNMKQREFADAINLSHGYVGDIEAGRKGAKYNINHLNEIAKVFKCSLWDLLPQYPLD